LRNAKLKYSGVIMAIIGFLLVAFWGWMFAWFHERYQSTNFDVFDYSYVLIIGMILLVSGILAYMLTEE